jgi:1-hydroxycarotenoid 3,4-desaturase
MRAVILGGGVGGLVAAATLRRRGWDVRLLERAPVVGGRVRTRAPRGRPVDVGPTVLTMRWVFDRVFDELGLRLDDHVRLVPAEILARHGFADGSVLDLFSDVEASAQAIERFADRREADGYRRFAAHGERIFDEVRGPFLEAQRPTVWSIAQHYGVGGLLRLPKIDGLRTLWASLGDFFRDPRLRQLFARYATYSGGSPFEAAGTLALIAHVERVGVAYVDGGMIALVQALEAINLRAGVEIECGAHVERVIVEGGRARGVALASGRRVDADVVVSAVDVSALAEGLLGPELTGVAAKLAPEARSLSALTFAIDAEVSGFPLIRHNVFFSADYAAEFRALREARRLPPSPTVYVCAQDRGDHAPEAAGPERLFCLVNAPAGAHEPEEIERCQTRMLEVLSRAGLKLAAPPPPEGRTTPMDFARDFPGTAGAIYGASPHGWRAPFERPAARTTIPGLYLAGGSVHPGAGVPMAALSARLAADAISQDLRSSAPSRPAAMPGGTSTR